MKSNFMDALYYLIFLLVMFNLLICIVGDELLVYICMIWVVVGFFLRGNSLKKEFMRNCEIKSEYIE